MSTWQFAIFVLDGWLRRRQGIHEYSSEPSCLFRIARDRAREAVCLSDGTSIAPGASVLSLHLWNEHIPRIDGAGANVRWARQLGRAVDLSLRELAKYLVMRVELDDVIAIRGDVRFSVARQEDQLERLCERFGFESVGEKDPSSAIHRVGENILIFLLALASNPNASTASIFRRNRRLVYISRAYLEQRYG